MFGQESEATLRKMQSEDHGQGLTAGEELGELDDEGDEEDEIVLDASNAQQSNRPQGELPYSSIFYLSCVLPAKLVKTTRVEEVRAVRDKIHSISWSMGCEH